MLLSKVLLQMSYSILYFFFCFTTVQLSCTMVVFVITTIKHYTGYLGKPLEHLVDILDIRLDVCVPVRRLHEATSMWEWDS